MNQAITPIYTLGCCFVFVCVRVRACMHAYERVSESVYVCAHDACARCIRTSVSWLEQENNQNHFENNSNRSESDAGQSIYGPKASNQPTTNTVSEQNKRYHARKKRTQRAKGILQIIHTE